MKWTRNLELNETNFESKAGDRTLLTYFKNMPDIDWMTENETLKTCSGVNYDMT